MGVVYEVRDSVRGCHLALKTLRNSRADTLMRFKHEFRALQGLRHPNLVELGELVEAGGQWFFTMELVRGVDFLEHVRPGQLAFGRTVSLAPPLAAPAGASSSASVSNIPPPESEVDLARLRDGLAQLARGLLALHRAGKVHRDVKPTNIRVTPEGRLVLLDFGLVADLTDGPIEVGRPLGTLEYMAPEQAAGLEIGPAADWYSVGALLYEALIGRPPFLGSPEEVLVGKRSRDPIPPREVAAFVPIDLNHLCMSLLARDPERRPDALAVLECVSQRKLARPEQLDPPVGTAPLLGRDVELDLLWRAHAAVRAGRTVAVLVHGESGIGKSTLIREFADSVAGDDTTVLGGRCSERELVPFRAVDGIVDALTRLSVREPRVRAAAPPTAELLALRLIFPVVGELDCAASAASDRNRDPLELRARGFAVLRRWLTRLGERGPVVLLIDDLQWADPDSLALLAELTRVPDPPRFLLLATVRTHPASWLGAGGPWTSLAGEVRHLRLDRLSPASARELACRWGANPAQADRIAEQSGGHPMLLDDLCRRLSSQSGPLDQESAPGDALWARVEGLDEGAFDLLKVLAVFEGPLLRSVAERARGVAQSALARDVARLRLANLARAARLRGQDAIEPVHQRVSEVVRLHLAPEERARIHRRLADALEGQEGADAEALAIHWEAAGSPARARLPFQRAAAEAEAALAFDRAARLWRHLLEAEPAGATRRQLLGRLGDALKNAGRGAEAAGAYLEAAALADHELAFELRRRAALELLHSGRLDEGLALFRTILAEVGMRLPRTTRGAAAALLARMVWVRCRGTRFRARAAAAIAPKQLRRVDLSRDVWVSLGFFDYVRGAYFQQRNLSLALAAGEPLRVGLSFAAEAPLAAATGLRRRAVRFLREAEQLAARSRDPYLRAFVAFSHGFSALQEGRWKTGQVFLDRAETMFREQCTGVRWEVIACQVASLWCLAYLGEIGELARRIPIALREARERGDVAALTNLRVGMPSLGRILLDQAEAARSEASEAIRQWSHQFYSAQHCFELMAQSLIDLYLGHDEAAWQRFEQQWPALKRSMFLGNRLIRTTMLHLRASSALALARRRDRAALLAVAARDVRRLRRQRTRPADAYADTLAAGIAHLRGDRERALALIACATSRFEEADMVVHAAVARYRFGCLTGGDVGQTATAAALSTLVAHQVRRPERAIAMLTPWFDDCPGD